MYTLNQTYRRILYIAIALLVLIVPVGLLFSELISFFNNKVSFLFTEPITQLAEYYPNYYTLVFIATRTIKYLAPVFFLYFLYKTAQYVYQKSKHARISLKQLVKSIFFYFFVSLVYFLMLYYLSDFNQLKLSRIFLSTQLIFITVLLLIHRDKLYGKMVELLFKPSLPFSISITRILFFFYLAFLYAFAFRTQWGSSLDGLTRSALPGWEWIISYWPVSNQIYSIICLLGAVVALLVAIGFKTRLFLVLNAIIIFYVASTPNLFGKLWHMQIVIWISWIFAFSNCYDVYSLDALSEKKEISKRSSYGFHLKMIWLHFGIIYFFAGFYKLWVSGFDWALSQSMINQIHLEWFENYQKIPSLRIDKIRLLVKYLGLFTIVFELFYIFLLLSRKTRYLAVIGGLIMHNAIGYLMHIRFLVFLQAFYIVFIPWDRIVERVKGVSASALNIIQDLKFKHIKAIGPIFILSSNVMFGIFRIDSYPFSVYPGYTDIVSDTFKCLSYEIKNQGSTKLNLWQEAQNAGFRWESFSRFEPQIVELYQDSNLVDTSAILQQWKRWELGVPILQDVHNVDVYAIEVFLDPEKQNDTIYKKLLMRIEN